MAYERQNYVAIYTLKPGTSSPIRRKRVKWEDAHKLKSYDQIVKMVILQDQNPDEYDDGPPASPELNDRWIVGANASYPWEGNEGKVATYVGSGSGWTFADPDDPTEVTFSGEASFGIDYGQHPQEGVTAKHITLPGTAKTRAFNKDGSQEGPITVAAKMEQTAASGDAFWYTYEEGDGTTYNDALALADQVDPMAIPLS